MSAYRVLAEALEAVAATRSKLVKIERLAAALAPLSGGELIAAARLLSGSPFAEWEQTVTSVGWATLAAVSSRRVYRGVAEDSVYVADEAQGQGVGGALLSALVAGAEAAGIWTIEAGIFPENGASIAVHQHCGFRIVGVREQLGRRDGLWRDVLLLERRSPLIS